LNGASSNSSYYTGATGGFEGVASSSAMTNCTCINKNQEGNTNKVVLAFKGVKAFLFNKLG
jgi:hypothetical protein